MLTSTVTYTEPNFDYSYTDIITSTTISYLLIRTTITATTPTALAVATQYAACRRKVATRIPTGENTTVSELDSNSDTLAVHADSAEACCAIYQATDLCVGGLRTVDIGSGAGYYFTRILNSPNGTCDGSRALNSFVSSGIRLRRGNLLLCGSFPCASFTPPTAFQSVPAVCMECADMCDAATGRADSWGGTLWRAIE